MQKNTHIFSLSVLLIASIATLGVSWSSATPKSLSGIFGKPHTIGSFLANGNAGKIIVGYPTPYIVDVDPSDPTGSGLVLTGQYMFLETAGWVTLTNDTANIPTSPIGIAFRSIPSLTTITSFELSGSLYGWSDNAGWIDFNPTNVSNGLIFRGGGLASFTGQAWSDTLGWLDFSEAYVDFLNKVKVIGNKGSEKIFDEIYSLGSKVESKNALTDFFNATVNPSIANLTRNISDSDERINKGTVTPADAKKLNNDVIIYKISDNQTVNASAIFNNSANDIRTLIVVGGSVIIDADILENTTVKKPRAIIAKKDANDKGGNIYINGAVKNIYTTLVAEGSVFSGNGTDKYNENDAERDTLPSNQLYIYGSSLSRNTIGGSQVQVGGKVVCPNLVTLVRGCDKDEAAIYDWNYFRTYDKSEAARSKKEGYDDYSVIIEYDSRLIGDPPPGLTN